VGLSKNPDPDAGQAGRDPGQIGSSSHCVEQFNRGPLPWAGHSPRPPQAFISQENYFPVFESSTRDLQKLEASVVINITAFYTFMKAARDSLRKLVEIAPQPAELGSPANPVPEPGSFGMK
jgi:hypothetical protein